MQIAFFTTGGTIDKLYFDSSSRFEVGEPVAPEILKKGRLNDFPKFTELLRKDSLELTDSDRTLIRAAVERCHATRVIITHGTDTMVKTARRLSDIPGKTIVLTGALQPARFTDSDASFNLGLAIAAVQLLSHGVYIAMSGQLFPAQGVRKNRERNRFEATA